MGSFQISRISSTDLTRNQRSDLVGMCNEAYGEELEPLFRALGPGNHLLGTIDGTLVSHAMWVTRWLQPRGLPELETAYVEMVATSPKHQSKGLATLVMQQLHKEIRDSALGALSPAETTLYSRLGWEYWQGNLFIRVDDTLQPTPDEQVMILRLPNTPPDLDLHQDLSAEWRAGEVW